MIIYVENPKELTKKLLNIKSLEDTRSIFKNQLLFCIPPINTLDLKLRTYHLLWSPQIETR